MKHALLLAMVGGLVLAPPVGPVSSAAGDSSGTVILHSVRARWPLARDPAGQWGIVGEVVAQHAWPVPKRVTSIDVDVYDAKGTRLARDRFDTPGALADVLRIGTVDGSSQSWKPAGSTDLAAGEYGVAFVAELVAARPAWTTVTVGFQGGASRRIAVPLELPELEEPLLWPTRPGSELWVATGTPGTAAHSQGGAVVAEEALHVSQRFAVDLRQIDGDFSTHPQGATRADQYYAWGEDVVSMGRGRVVAAVFDDPDYEIGDVIPPSQHPAGNHVVVQYGRSMYAVYAHLQRSSVRVRVGDWVERGETLALVGNSGSSSEPHLHVHVTDRWLTGVDPLASFFLSQGIPARLWGARVLRNGGWVPMRGAMPTELDIILPTGLPR